MSPVGPQQPGQRAGKSAVRAARRLRNLPGFTAAAVVFVLIVLLGGGGAAIAKWNQSATVAIAITAGAAPTPSSTPTPSPTPSVSATPSTNPTPAPSGQGNIVLNPKIEKRPQIIALAKQNADVTCSYQGNPENGQSGKFNFAWTPSGSNVTGYVVSLTWNGSGSGFNETLAPDPEANARFSLGKDAAPGQYILRIQPMNATVAGDPIYATFRYQTPTDFGCWDPRRNGTSPLGSVAVNIATMRKTDNVMQVSWTPSQATRYVVSIESASGGESPTKKTYGAEFPTASLGATLTFPPRELDQWKNPVPDADYFGDYLLRVMPMNGKQAGDPVYKWIRYMSWGTAIWDYIPPK